MTTRWRDPCPRPIASELGKVEGRPLRPQRLAQIWATLPEQERLPFILSLEEYLSYQVIEVTYEQVKGQTEP